MEFEKWMNYLINVSCAVFQIDPAEVNFPNNGGVGGKGASMMEGGHKEKFNQSKDKGLKPLLTFVASLINKYVIWQFSSDFIFTFKGLNENSEKDQAELDASQVKTYKTVNEIRAEHDQDPIENGDIILDGVFVQYMSNLQQQQQQRAMMVMQQLQQAQQQQAMQNNVVQPTSDTEPSQSDVNDNNSDTKKSISMKFDI
jgi:hypothetical protein